MYLELCDLKIDYKNKGKNQVYKAGGKLNQKVKRKIIDSQDSAL
ncbi:hypothetical protein [Aureispira anguillae]|nr:hypothetical protein [Aureispira anguillae]